METLFQDLRYAVRAMFKSPGFTAIAILSLALGIGANTSIFSVVNALLLKPLPYNNPDQLAQVFRQYETTGKGTEVSEAWSYPKFVALRDNNDSFEHVAAVSSQNFPVTDSDNPERLATEIVSASYFKLLGVQAEVGRTFTPEEDQTPGAHPVALISHDVWQRRFGSDPNRSLLRRTIHGSGERTSRSSVGYRRIRNPAVKQLGWNDIAHQGAS
jgi:MacB-like periplasmic core domain